MKKKTPSFDYLHITGNLMGVMTATGKTTVSAGGYTLNVYNGHYKLYDKDGKVMDEWDGLHENRFESTAYNTPKNYFES